jgi:hypothetical protein
MESGLGGLVNVPEVHISSQAFQREPVTGDRAWERRIPYLDRAPSRHWETLVSWTLINALEIEEPSELKGGMVDAIQHYSPA